MTRTRLLTAAKVGWLVVVIAAAAWYVRRHGAGLGDAWAVLAWPRAIAALAVLLLAKLALAQTARLSLRAVGHEMSWRDSLRMYSVSQLGKYAPGGVWHLVGRFGMYRMAGAEARPASIAMALESAWLLSSALFVGLMLLWPALLGERADVASSGALHIGGSVLLGAAWIGAMVVSVRLISGARPGSRIALQAAGWQAVIWVLLGICFWIAMPDDTRDAVGLAPSIGVFALGWAVGYVAVFAPAGLGVREGVMVALLQGSAPLAAALALAAINRVVWTVAELGLGVVFLADRGARRLTEPAAPGSA